MVPHRLAAGAAVQNPAPSSKVFLACRENRLSQNMGFLIHGDAIYAETEKNMRLHQIVEIENTKSKQHEKIFNHDLTVLFAGASLLMIFLFSGNLFYWLLKTQEKLIISVVSAMRGVTLEEAREGFFAFYHSEILEGAVTLTVSVISVLLPALFIKKYLLNKPPRLYPLKLKKGLPPKTGTFIFFAIGLSFAVNLLCSFLFSGLYPKDTGGDLRQSAFSAAVYFILVVVAAPFGEELFFRGTFFQSLSRYGETFAVFLSALVFSLAHPDLPKVINAFVMGICLAVAFAKTKSVALCVLIHLINNALAFAVPYLITGSLGVAYQIVFGVAILSAAAFAVAAVINYLATGKAKILVFDDGGFQFARLSKGKYAKILFKNFFFYFFVTLAIFGTVITYL